MCCKFVAPENIFVGSFGFVHSFGSFGIVVVWLLKILRKKYNILT